MPLYGRNKIFKLTSATRGLAVPLMTPKLAVELALTRGLLRCTLFNVLKNSPRNCVRNRSVIVKFLWMPESMLKPRQAAKQIAPGVAKGEVIADRILPCAIRWQRRIASHIGAVKTDSAERIVAAEGEVGGKPAAPIDDLRDRPSGATLTNTDQRRQLYPNYASLVEMVSDGNSHYHSMQLTVEKRFSRNFSFLAFHTFSKLIDDESFNAQFTVANPFVADIRRAQQNAFRHLPRETYRRLTCS